MIVKDRIYGDIIITNPVIVDLINSQPMLRLKEISQDGAVHFIQPVRNVTRFEHSIGTWYLSYRYKRPLEEQIAALLHDTPHTAFSHVIDFVVGDQNHEYHDNFLEQVILRSDIPEILSKHQIDLEKVLRKEDFPLLENNLPDISVDRWDYFMRDGYMKGLLPKEVIQLFLKSIKEKHGVFYFVDLQVASLFAVLFLNFCRLIWLDPTSHGSYFLLANAIKLALEKHYLTHSDLFRTDIEVMETLQGVNDKEIQAFLARLVPGKEFHYAPKGKAEFYGTNKPRFVDPIVLVENSYKRISDLIPEMKEYFTEFETRYAAIGVIQEGE